MQIPRLLVAMSLTVAACTHEPPLPPALPEEPVLLAPLLPLVMNEDQFPLLETSGMGIDGYQQLPPARRFAAPTSDTAVQPVRFVEPPVAPPERPKARALSLDKLIAQANQAAQVLPTEEGYFGGRAIYHYRYTPGKVYVIPTHPETFTKLYFPPSEQKATEPTLNEEVWKTEEASMGPPERRQYILAVRPKEGTPRADIALEMESGRSYFLRFVPSKTPMLAVTWELPLLGPAASPETHGTAPPYGTPGTRQPLLMPVDLARLHTGYRLEFKGNPSFVPLQVYDDGTRTIVKMKALTGNAPVVFTYKLDGSRGLVQFAPHTIPGDPTSAMYYVIENIWPKLELAGTDGASVFITRLSEGLTIAQPWTRH